MDISAAFLISSGEFKAIGNGGSADVAAPILDPEGGGGLETVGLGYACSTVFVLAFATFEDTVGPEAGTSGSDALGKSMSSTLGLVPPLLVDLLPEAPFGG